MGWVLPADFVDPSETWLSETLAYDEDTETYAYDANVPADSWGRDLELTRAAINCSKVRFWTFYNVASQSSIDLDVYYDGAWHDVYEGSYANLEWVEKELGGTYSVTAARVKFYNEHSSSNNLRLYEFEFWEAPVSAPTVTTQAVSDIEPTTATGNGNITATGGENCSKRGICWNTTGSPTVADSKSEETDSFGTGAFTRPMTGLTPGEHYYVKAYAYNSAGYGYGGEVEFTAKNPITVTPGTLALTLTTYSPTVLTPRLVTPPTLALTLTTYTPSVIIGVIVTPSTLALILTSYAPTVGISDHITVTPATLALSLTTYAPAVSTPRLVTPSTLALLLTTYAPVMFTPIVVTPDTFELVLTTYAPRLWSAIKTLKLHPYAYSKERTVEL